MPKKEITIMDVANKGNWEYHNGENRCIYCGEYQFQNQHDKDCPLGKLIMTVNQITLKELINCLSGTDKIRVLKLVQKAGDSLMGAETLEIEVRYIAIKKEIEKYIFQADYTNYEQE